MRSAMRPAALTILGHREGPQVVPRRAKSVKAPVRAGPSAKARRRRKGAQSIGAKTWAPCGICGVRLAHSGRFRRRGRGGNQPCGSHSNPRASTSTSWATPTSRSSASREGRSPEPQCSKFHRDAAERVIAQGIAPKLARAGLRAPGSNVTVQRALRRRSRWPAHDVRVLECPRAGQRLLAGCFHRRRTRPSARAPFRS